jgi:hypothetical protein
MTERDVFWEETNMTTRKHSRLFAAAAPLLFALPMAASADEDAERVSANLMGYQETPSTLSSPGTGVFRAKIAENDQSFDWVLTFSGLTAVAQAHIHFGARALSGGVSIFLCSNLGNGPPGTQPCPVSAGTVSGTARATDVIGPAAQGINPGEFAKILDAIRSGVAYANVHTAARPGGEIRGQISAHGDRDR